MTTPIILHIDMDAFFASIEQLDDPALRGRCVVVGGAHRGVVAAASYEARKYGIHSAMPIFQAKHRCPHLVIVPPRRKRYAELSTRIMTLLRTFSPLVEPISIDEAFLDIAGCQRLQGSPVDTARAIKAAVQTQIRLTCSVGLAPNKFLAKIASDLNKPDGLTVIDSDQVQPFIETLPIEKVPGVGPRARHLLGELGIAFLGQVRHFSEDRLVRRLGKFGYRLMALAHGRDERAVIPESEAKSISSEVTLARNTVDRDVLSAHLLQQAEAVARQLRRQHMRARTITLKLKRGDFKQHTRRHTMDHPVQSSDTIYAAVLALLDAFGPLPPIRLVGVAAGSLQPASLPVQQSLFAENGPDHTKRWEQIDKTVDSISERFGRHVILRGTLAKDGGRSNME